MTYKFDKILFGNHPINGKNIKIENKKYIETPNSFLFSSQVKTVLKTIVQTP